MTTTVNASSKNLYPYDAGLDKVTFKFAVGNYSYGIDYFGSGDKILLPSGYTKLSIQQAAWYSEPNGGLDIKAEYPNAKTVHIVLSNITNAQDSAIHGVNSFNDVFGADSLASGTPYVPPPGHGAAFSVSTAADNPFPYDASKGNVSFNFAADNYTYNIEKFGAGDKIMLPSGYAKLSIQQDAWYSEPNGGLDIEAKYGNKTVHIALTGITNAQDSAIHGVNSFNDVFGADSLASGTPYVPPPGHGAAFSVSAAAGNPFPYDAGKGKVAFYFAAGSYTYNIEKFNVGDKIVLAAEPTALSVRQEAWYSEPNGGLEIEAQYGGKTVHIALTGIANAQDSAINSVNTFNRTFGAGSLSIGPANNPPTGHATAHLPPGSQNTAYTLKAADLLQGFSDADGDSLSVAGLSAAHGKLTDNHDGTWRFDPAADYSGAVALQYSVVDGKGGSLAAAQSFTLSAGPGVAITGGSAATSESGAQASFAVRLAAAPHYPVTLAFTSSDPGEGKVLTPSLTFTPDNWDQAQALVVKGVDDYLDDGNIAYTVSTKIVTYALEYMDLNVGTLNLVNQDDGLDTPVEWYGSNGVDYKSGGNGNDKLYGQGSADELKGGPGDDRLYGEQGNDRLFGEPGKDELWGGYDDDTLDGGDGNDKLYGEGGNDKLYGGAGNDSLDGGLGADFMTGGPGSDVYYVDNPGEKVDDQGAPGDLDTVVVTQVFVYQLSPTVENARLQGPGDGGLTGNARNNTLTGNDGNNTLGGAAGDDTLQGGKGGDTLAGGDGNDILVGGAGKDTLTGGKGADAFRLIYAADSPAAAPDRIADFNHGQADKIDLAAAYASTLRFVGQAAFSHTAGELHYTAAAGGLLVAGDTNGDAAADFTVQLTGAAKLVAGDFIL